VHLLPGTTFSNTSEKGSYDWQGRAVLTLPEWERWLARQIAGVYHLTVHSALGKTPWETSREGVAKRRTAWLPAERRRILSGFPARRLPLGSEGWPSLLTRFATGVTF